ncbi:MAG: hypothetical protein J7M19_08145 [Planctomycetes bacterium]|nr:hypothetical protein [Planctomycetota bacterium]
MIRRLLLVGIIVAVGFSLGCGGGTSPLDIASEGKPKDIGTAADWPMGAKIFASNVWITKVDKDGEVRLMAVYGKAPEPGAGYVKYDPDSGIFYTRRREFTYDLEGNSLKKYESGEFKGLGRFPLIRKPVEIDAESGHILVYFFGKVVPNDRDDPEKRAYVAVP